jgi:hypothetical protein
MNSDELKKYKLKTRDRTKAKQKSRLDIPKAEVRIFMHKNGKVCNEDNTFPVARFHFIYCIVYRELKVCLI